MVTNFQGLTLGQQVKSSQVNDQETGSSYMTRTQRLIQAGQDQAQFNSLKQQAEDINSNIKNFDDYKTTYANLSPQLKQFFKSPDQIQNEINQQQQTDMSNIDNLVNQLNQALQQKQAQPYNRTNEIEIAGLQAQINALSSNRGKISQGYSYDSIVDYARQVSDVTEGNLRGNDTAIQQGTTPSQNIGSQQNVHLSIAQAIQDKSITQMNNIIKQFEKQNPTEKITTKGGQITGIESGALKQSFVTLKQYQDAIDKNNKEYEDYVKGLPKSINPLLQQAYGKTPNFNVNQKEVYPHVYNWGDVTNQPLNLKAGTYSFSGGFHKVTQEEADKQNQLNAGKISFEQYAIYKVEKLLDQTWLLPDIYREDVEILSKISGKTPQEVENAISGIVPPPSVSLRLALFEPFFSTAPGRNIEAKGYEGKVGAIEFDLSKPTTLEKSASIVGVKGNKVDVSSVIEKEGKTSLETGSFETKTNPEGDLTRSTGETLRLSQEAMKLNTAKVNAVESISEKAGDGNFGKGSEKVPADATAKTGSIAKTIKTIEEVETLSAGTKNYLTKVTTPSIDELKTQVAKTSEGYFALKQIKEPEPLNAVDMSGQIKTLLEEEDIPKKPVKFFFAGFQGGEESMIADELAELKTSAKLKVLKAEGGYEFKDMSLNSLKEFIKNGQVTEGLQGELDDIFKHGGEINAELTKIIKNTVKGEVTKTGIITVEPEDIIKNEIKEATAQNEPLTFEKVSKQGEMTDEELERQVGKQFNPSGKSSSDLSDQELTKQYAKNIKAIEDYFKKASPEEKAKFSETQRLYKEGKGMGKKGQSMGVNPLTKYVDKVIEKINNMKEVDITNPTPAKQQAPEKAMETADNIENNILKNQLKEKITQRNLQQAIKGLNALPQLEEGSIFGTGGVQPKGQFWGELGKKTNLGKKGLMSNLEDDFEKSIFSSKTNADLKRAIAGKINLGVDVAILSGIKSGSQSKTKIDTDLDTAIRGLVGTGVDVGLNVDQKIDQAFGLKFAQISMTEFKFDETQFFEPTLDIGDIGDIDMGGFGFGGSVKRKIKKKSKRIKTMNELSLMPDFTSRALGLAPDKIAMKDVNKALSKIYTGFEIRRGAVLK